MIYVFVLLIDVYAGLSVNKLLLMANIGNA